VNGPVHCSTTFRYRIVGVAHHPFLFAVTVPNQGGFDEMLADVAACVLNHLGFAAPTIADILGELRGALARGAAEGAFDSETRFAVEAEMLVIVVSYPGGREWRTARPLP